MNKSDLVDAVANAATVGKREVDQMVGVLIDQITRALQAGEKVTLPGLGNLSTAATRARVGRNPRTGVAVKIPAGVRVKFTASSALKSAVASKRGAKKTAAKKTTARKAATKKTTARKPAAKKPAAKKTATKKSAAKKTVARKPAAKKTAKKAVRKR